MVKMLGQLPMHLERTLTHAKASQLANYLIDVTKAFGGFYRECRVLSEDAELSRARLMLVEATRRILAQGLGLLGIPLAGNGCRRSGDRRSVKISLPG